MLWQNHVANTQFRQVGPEWLGKTGEKDEVEDTMLEMTNVEQQPNSRLSCQIIASPELDGLVVHVPEPD